MKTQQTSAIRLTAKPVEVAKITFTTISDEARNGMVPTVLMPAVAISISPAGRVLAARDASRPFEASTSVVFAGRVLAARDASRAAEPHSPLAGAPDEVRMAWSAATQGMSNLERAAAEGALMAEEISANLIFDYDPNERVVGWHQRGEAGYVDLWNRPGVPLSYPAVVDGMLKNLEENQPAYSAKDYAFTHDVLSRFRAALS